MIYLRHGQRRDKLRLAHPALTQREVEGVLINEDVHLLPTLNTSDSNFVDPLPHPPDVDKLQGQMFLAVGEPRSQIAVEKVVRWGEWLPLLGGEVVVVKGDDEGDISTLFGQSPGLFREDDRFA